MGLRGADSPDSLVTAATREQIAWCPSDLSSAVSCDGRTGVFNYRLCSLVSREPRRLVQREKLREEMLQDGPLSSPRRLLLEAWEMLVLPQQGPLVQTQHP